MKKFSPCYLFTILLILAFFVSCSSTSMISKWNESPVSIDGNIDDWNKNLFYYEDPGILLGFGNDHTNLYLCFASADKDIINQIAMGGMKIWFDNEGDSEKKGGIGIHFERPERPMNDNQPRNFMDMQWQDRIVRRLKSFDKIAILGKDGEASHVLSVKETNDIDAALDFVNNRLIFEMKLPFKKNKQYVYSIESDTGRTIGIGFETPDMKEMIKERMSRQPLGGGMRGGGMRGGGMRGGGMARERPSIPDPLDFWLEVSLTGDTKK